MLYNTSYFEKLTVAIQQSIINYLLINNFQAAKQLYDQWLALEQPLEQEPDFQHLS